jgi:hypothetical protein
MRRGTWAALAAMLLAFVAHAAAQGVEPLQVVQRNYMLPVSGPQGTRMALLDAASVQWSSAAQAQAAQAAAEPLMDAATAQQLSELPSTLSQPDQGAFVVCCACVVVLCVCLGEGRWPATKHAVPGSGVKSG